MFTKHLPNRFLKNVLLFVTIINIANVSDNCPPNSVLPTFSSKRRHTVSDMMRKVGVIVVCLVLSIFPHLIDGQSKTFACSFNSQEAASIGFLPEYVPMEICTHVIFKWFRFPRFVARQMLFDDNDKIAFSRLVTSVRQRSRTGRVVASIDGTGSDFSSASGTNVRRRAFVQAASTLLLELDADAIELNWERPGNENSGTGIATDRLTMVTLLQDLRQVVNAASSLIKGRPRELWIRGTIHPNLISSSYNTFDVCDLVDQVTLDTTSTAGSTSHAPIYSTSITLPNFGPFKGNVINTGDGLTDATQTWIDNGCPPKKVLLGIGLHGYLKTGSSSDQGFLSNRFLSLSASDGKRMAYRELCQTLRERGWSFGWDQQGFTPYATRSFYNGQLQRLSYEDVNSLRYKMDLVEQKRLGGVYVNNIHSDDIYGTCGQAYALAGYIASRLQAIPSDIGFAIEWN
ncbi:endochitinase-like [Anopheles ziemanni]|uniref:endochitinase-like n=1 Tax=Anopheles coustani TaxID=139045 RepID=UPI00265A3155|nr:endochitinase-like [Anopheles coustani]XP_058177245.1 endochitinase-like [Anopheles ziemanni]